MWKSDRKQTSALISVEAVLLCYAQGGLSRTQGNNHDHNKEDCDNYTDNHNLTLQRDSAARPKICRAT